MKTERRKFMHDLAVTAGALTALGGGPLKAATAGATPSPASEQLTVRDKFWMWGHIPGSLDHQFNIPGESRMTPAEAATYFNVPNIIMVEIYASKWNPETKKLDVDQGDWLPHPPYDPWLISFRPFKRVVWSVLWGGGMKKKEKLEMIRKDLSQKYPNIVGVQMDDFKKLGWSGKWYGALPPADLDWMQHELKEKGQKLDLWGRFYVDAYPLEDYLLPSLTRVDVTHWWTWEAKNLAQFEDNFRKVEKVIPKSRKVIGCFMWDFGGSKPMPISVMEKHCQMGLKMLREGRIEGMIFFGSPICDKNLETVEWTRNWIREVGDQKL